MASQQNSSFIFRYPVHSSLLTSIGYCPITCLLDLELRDGSLYRYHRVPACTYLSLLLADSKGCYFNRHIKHIFHYQRFVPSTPQRHSLDESFSIDFISRQTALQS